MNKLHTCILFFMTAGLSLSCTAQDVRNMALRSVIPNDNILIGAAVNQWLVASDLGLAEHKLDDPSYKLVGTTDQMQMEVGIVPREFNCVTAENCWKSEVIAPRRGIYDFTLADQFMVYAKKHGMAVIGHAPIWHSQQAKWLTRDDEGNLVDKETCKENIRSFIFTVYGHFRGKVKGYDVVNECIEDDGSYRQSDFYQIMGEEYIDWAFQCAQEADPDGELYYNDFSMFKPGKRATVVKLIKRLKEKGIRIDAVGLQCHYGMDFPEFPDFEASVKAFIEAGVDVQFTELDMSILPNPYTGADVSTRFDYSPEKDPYKNGLTNKAFKEWQNRFREFFAIVNKYSDHVKRVTFWGVSDASSWRNDFPIPGRTDYPLPFDREGKYKF